MCKTESLCCTAKNKHNILHQLYFNKIKKKMSQRIRTQHPPPAHSKQFQGLQGPEKASCQPCWPLRARFSLSGQLLAHGQPPEGRLFGSNGADSTAFLQTNQNIPGCFGAKPRNFPAKGEQTLKVLGCRLVQHEKKKKSPDFLPRTQGQSGCVESEGRGPSVLPGNPGVCKPCARSWAVSEFLTVVSRGFSSLSPERSQELGLKHTSLAGDLENSPINHRSDS